MVDRLDEYTNPGLYSANDSNPLKNYKMCALWENVVCVLERVNVCFKESWEREKEYIYRLRERAKAWYLNYSELRTYCARMQGKKTLL